MLVRVLGLDQMVVTGLFFPLVCEAIYAQDGVEVVGHGLVYTPSGAASFIILHQASSVYF